MHGADGSAYETAEVNDLTKLRREPFKADPRWSTIRDILSSTWLCHLAVVDHDGQPIAIPTVHALVGNDLYLHGSAASRTIKRATGGKVCVTATEVNGFVMARSVLNHSVNFRSVMVFGTAELIDDPDEKERALHDYFETVFPGRWAEVRPPSENETKQVSIAKVPLETASAKIGEGPPDDEDEDYALDVWAGLIPIRQVLDDPVADPALRDGIPPTASLERIRERWSHRAG